MSEFALWKTRGVSGCVAVIFSLASALSCVGQTSPPIYQNNFESAEVDSVPDDFIVLDGGFTVKEDQGNKFLELPGAPVDSFGVLFGPVATNAITATARAFGTSTGRRYPTFALGLNGAGGYRIQVSPGKRALELIRGDSVKASVPYNWKSGKWTRLKLHVQKSGDSWRIAGKAWPEGEEEPADWLITADETQALSPGRASVYGSPLSGTRIRFDDLVVSRCSSPIGTPR